MDPDDTNSGRPVPGRRRPGTRDPEGNRQAVLDAARKLFGAHGYTGVGVRAIAAEAGVTPGLVMAYFGTKDGLFREMVGGGAGVSREVLDAAAEDEGDLPAALARAYLDRWDRLPADDPWTALIRSAVGHPPSADMLRTILEKQVGEPLARLLGDSPGADVRAALIRSILFGVVMERYLFAHEPAASVPTDELAPALTEVLTTAFGDALGGGRTAHSPAQGAGISGSWGSSVGTSSSGSSSGGPVDSGQEPAVRHERGRPGVDDSPASLLARLNDCALRHQTLMGRVVRPFGISLSACDVLTTLHDAGHPYRLTMGEVAAAGVIRAGGLTQQADRMEAAGLIRRERDTGDRRVVRLSLTPEGIELAGRVGAVRSAQEQELLAGMSGVDRRRLGTLLDALGRTLGAGEPER